MPDINIFVSHRIDVISELIDNPLYVTVRFGMAIGLLLGELLVAIKKKYRQEEVRDYGKCTATGI